MAGAGAERVRVGPMEAHADGPANWQGIGHRRFRRRRGAVLLAARFERAGGRRAAPRTHVPEHGLAGGKGRALRRVSGEQRFRARRGRLGGVRAERDGPTAGAFAPGAGRAAKAAHGLQPGAVRRDRHARGSTRSVDRGEGRREGALVDRAPARRQACPAPPPDPWRPARNLGRRMGHALERGGLRRARVRRPRGGPARIDRLRPRVRGADLRRLGRPGVRRPDALGGRGGEAALRPARPDVRGGRIVRRLHDRLDRWPHRALQVPGQPRRRLRPCRGVRVDRGAMVPGMGDARHPVGRP